MVNLSWIMTIDSFSEIRVCVFSLLDSVYLIFLWSKVKSEIPVQITVSLLLSYCYTGVMHQITCVIECENSCPWILWKVVFGHAGREGEWLEWMLPAECGIVSLQHLMRDTLPNAAGFEYKSSSWLPWTYASSVPWPISTTHLMPFAFLLPFGLHTSSSSLLLSLTIFGNVLLSFNSPPARCDTLHRFMSVYLCISFFPFSFCLIFLFLSISLSCWSNFFTSCPSDAFFLTRSHLFIYFLLSVFISLLVCFPSWEGIFYTISANLKKVDEQRSSVWPQFRHLHKTVKCEVEHLYAFPMFSTRLHVVGDIKYTD